MPPTIYDAANLRTIAKENENSNANGRQARNKRLSQLISTTPVHRTRLFCVMKRSLTLFLLLLGILLRSTSSDVPYAGNEVIFVVTDEDDKLPSSSPRRVSVNDILSDPSHWLIQFYSSETGSLPTSDVFSDIATLLHGIVKAVVVDVSSAAGKQLATKYGVKKSGSKTLLIGDNRDTPSLTYDKDLPALEGLANAVMNVVAKTINNRSQSLGQKFHSKPSSRKGQGSQVIYDVTVSNFEEKVLQNPHVVVVAFTAPWCGHCKRLQPDWEEAASRLAREPATMVWVDATVNEALSSRYNVRGYPTIKIFKGGAPKTGEAIDYNGERTASALVENILLEVDRSGVVSASDIPELTSDDILMEECAGHNHICVLAALPHILDGGAEGRNKYRELIAKVSKAFRGTGAFSFMWFEGSSQPDLEEALELSFGFPALVAFSLDRRAYAVLHGSFTEKAMTTFLHGITTGRQPTVPLRNGDVPKIVTVTPWDGQDGAPIEEEMSLDEIMGWDDDDGENNGEQEEL